MRASLHTDLRVSGSILIDTRLGLRYSLTPDAAWLLGQLLQDGRVDSLATAVARLKHLPLSDAKSAIFSLLGQLGAHGSVMIQGGSVHDIWIRWRWPQRYPKTMSGFVLALWRAYGFFAFIESAFMAAYLLGGISSVWVWLPFYAVLSFTMHELGHVLAAQLCQTNVALLARPGYMALLYKRPARRRALCIAAAGPASAALSCLYFAVQSLQIVQFFLIALAVLHLLSLLPFFADGKTIWR